MVEEINVISSNLDGAELRREKRKNSYYSRCDNKHDQEEINEAINSFGVKRYSIPGEIWERIFGGNK